MLKPSAVENFSQHVPRVTPLLHPVEVVSLTGIPSQVIQLPPVPDVIPVWPLGVEVRVQEAHPLRVAKLRRSYRVT